MAPRHFFSVSWTFLYMNDCQPVNPGISWSLSQNCGKWMISSQKISLFFLPFLSIQRLRATGDAIKQHLKGVILCHILVQCLLPPQASVTEAICSQIAKGISWGFHKGCKVMESTLADCLLVSPEIIYCTGQYGKIKGWKTG